MCVAYSPEQVKKYQYCKPKTSKFEINVYLGSEPIPFVKRDWKKIDPEFQSLIKSCLEYEPSNRISAKDALRHEALN
jgi:serine/threonine protein kinase